MADVHILPGVTRSDLVQQTDIKTIIQSASDAGLKDIAIVGRGLDGEISVWSSHTDADQAIGMMMRGVNWLASVTQVSGEETA